MREGIKATIGLDVGDKQTHVCVLDQANGQVSGRSTFASSHEGLAGFVDAWRGQSATTRVVLEVGTNSPWMSRGLVEAGFEVFVGNARELRFIFGSPVKTDVADAEKLARLGRVDPQLLRPIRHRTPQDQVQITALRARDGLVRTRAALVNRARGLAKASGCRLPTTSTRGFAARVLDEGVPVPPELRQVLRPLLEATAAVTEQIAAYDRMITQACQARYPETRTMSQVQGVGDLTALAVRLVLQDRERFRRSRDVGPYLGLTPGRDQSGEKDRSLGITKRGDPFARRLLVQSAHYILGPFGEDSNLRRFGLGLIERGVAKKRAVTATARKLAVLLYRLWKTGEVYEPLRGVSPPVA